MIWPENLTILRFKSKYIYPVVFIIVLIILPQGASAQDNQISFESRLATIYIRGNVDLKLVDKNLNTSRIQSIYFTDYARIESGSLIERISAKFDLLVLRTQEILDMYPDDFHVNIVIYEHDDSLAERYQEIKGERIDLYSFYYYNNNTIYTSQCRLTANVMAHEIGHAVCNNYFVILPPAKIRELLSQYVDVHLKD